MIGQVPGKQDTGVSEVVGEMLMIGLVVLLVAVFSSVLFNFLPGAHAPGVTIKVSNDTQGNVTLWHKGGDVVKTDDLMVIVGNDTARKKYFRTDGRGDFILVPYPGTSNQTFDLGGNITVITGISDTGIVGNETISLVTSDAEIFSGRVWIP
ncbi:MAG: type IV pilin N-terminal domain-containing protein [Methanoregulaceae archaeon]